MFILTKTERRLALGGCLAACFCAGQMLSSNDPLLVVLAATLAALGVAAAFVAGWSREPQEVTQVAAESAKYDPMDWVAVREDDVR